MTSAKPSSMAHHSFSFNNPLLSLIAHYHSFNPNACGVPCWWFGASQRIVVIISVATFIQMQPLGAKVILVCAKAP
jgi:hypothetical protein